MIPKFKQFRRRGKEVVYQKVGHSESEKDDEFDWLYAHFQAKDGALRELESRLQNYYQCQRAANDAHMALADSVSDILNLQLQEPGMKEKPRWGLHACARQCAGREAIE